MVARHIRKLFLDKLKETGDDPESVKCTYFIRPPYFPGSPVQLRQECLAAGLPECDFSALRHDDYALPEAEHWPSFHISQWRALSIWEKLNAQDFADHNRITVLENESEIVIGGEEIPCYSSYYEGY